MEFSRPGKISLFSVSWLELTTPSPEFTTLAVNQVLHLVPGVVQEEVREPDLHLSRADGVHAGLVLQVDELQPAVPPAEAHRELRPVGGEDGVQPGEGVEVDGGHDGELVLAGGREELVVAGVDLYHPAIQLVRGVLAVRLPVTPGQRFLLADTRHSYQLTGLNLA